MSTLLPWFSENMADISRKLAEFEDNVQARLVNNDDNYNVLHRRVLRSSTPSKILPKMRLRERESNLLKLSFLWPM